MITLTTENLVDEKFGPNLYFGPNFSSTNQNLVIHKNPSMYGFGGGDKQKRGWSPKKIVDSFYTYSISILSISYSV